MKTIQATSTLILAGGVLCAALAGCGAELAPPPLPKPRLTGGKPLMQALQARHTSRAFSPEQLPAQTLSDLLWAANGINRPAQDKDFYSATDAGFVSQNVYLFCASEGLATVVRGMLDRPALAKAMALRPDQKIILAQTIGFPKKENSP